VNLRLIVAGATVGCAMSLCALLHGAGIAGGPRRAETTHRTVRGIRTRQP
jgi:hypothetical protein